MWYDIFFIIFFLVSVVSTALVYYSLKRINILEGVIVNFQQIVEYSYNRLKAIDNTGHFESDDEVGFVFEEIKTLQGMLNDLFIPEDTQGEPLGGEKEKE